MIVASLFEIIPTFLIQSNVPTIASVKPYTPLELAGRDIYIREGCYNCHSQMVRPFRDETERYGEYSKPGEFVYDHPFQWGSRRIGPDLAAVGGKYPDLWHVRHMEDPRSITSRLDHADVPAAAHGRRSTSSGIQSRVDAMAMLGRALRRRGDAGAGDGPGAGRSGSRRTSPPQGGPADLADKEIVALVAYLQRLGTDIRKGAAAAAGGGAAARRGPLRCACPTSWRNAGLSGYAEIALILFMVAFVAIVVRIFRPGAARRRWTPPPGCPSTTSTRRNCGQEIAHEPASSTRTACSTTNTTASRSTTTRCRGGGSPPSGSRSSSRSCYLLNVPGVGVGQGRVADYEAEMATAAELAAANDPLARS